MTRSRPRERLALAAGALLLVLGVSAHAGDVTIATSPTDRAASAMRRGDYQTALDELRPLAANGDADAEFLLGMLYDAGKGVPQDRTAAASWYRKAAEQKHVTAQAYLGAMCYSGDGVKQDYPQAARWLGAAAANGNDFAQFYLGTMYANGVGVAKNEEVAIQWLTKAAAQKNTRAMGMLASLLFSRSRDDQDRIDAYVWSHLAAEFDPIQAATSARVVTEKYCNSEQTKRAKKAMSAWKKQWASE